MKFLNRTEEIKRLNKAIARKKASLIILYGRRRVGKSTLIGKIMKTSDIYYMAQQTDASLQRNLMARTIAIVIKGFDKVIYPDWDALFSNLSVIVKTKTVLCLDEFPYMVKTSPEIPSVIQKWWDANKNGKCSLILSGSAQQMMRDFAFNSNNPLYGRANEIMKIEPLLPGYITDALKVNPVTAVEEYSIFGGVPRYWELRQEYPGLQQAIIHLIYSRLGILHLEPSRLFLDDMRESVQAYSILTVIGFGANRLSEIAARLNKPSTQLSGPLDLLIHLGYIKRESPFGENPRNAKRSLYKINDPFLAFYFKIPVPNMSALQQGLELKIWKQTAGLLDTHIASIWEELCRKAVPAISFGKQNFGPASRWWNGQIELDAVALSDDQKTLFVGECKWSEVKNAETLAKNLVRKAESSGLAEDKTILPVIFAKKANLPSQGQFYRVYTPKEIMSCLR